LHSLVVDTFSGVRKSDGPCGAQGNAYLGTYWLVSTLRLTGYSLAQFVRIVKEKEYFGHSNFQWSNSLIDAPINVDNLNIRTFNYENMLLWCHFSLFG